MDFLAALWTASIVLSALAVAASAVLIVRRVLARRSAARRERLRAAVMDRLLDHLDGTGDAAAILDAAEGRVGLASTLVIELAAMLEGEARDRLVALLRAWDAPAHLVRALRTGDSRRRRDAAEALRLLASETVVAELRGALADASADVRLAAARSLAEMERLPPVADLVPAMRAAGGIASVGWRSVFRRAAEADPAGLLAVARSAGSRDARLFAVDAMARIPDPAVLEALTALADDPDTEVRAAALRTFAAIGHPAAEAALRRGFADPAWEVRTQAAVAAGRIGLASMHDLLAAQLHDPVWWPRYRAGQALVRLGEAGVARLRAVRGAGGSAARIAELALLETGTA